MLRLRALYVGGHRHLAQLLLSVLLHLHLHMVPLMAMSAVLRLGAGAAAAVRHLQFRGQLEHVMWRGVE